MSNKLIIPSGYTFTYNVFYSSIWLKSAKKLFITQLCLYWLLLYFFYFKAICHVMGYHDGTQNFTIKKYDILAFKWRVLSNFSIPGSKVISKNKRRLVKCPGLYQRSFNTPVNTPWIRGWSESSSEKFFTLYHNVTGKCRLDTNKTWKIKFKYFTFFQF